MGFSNFYLVHNYTGGKKLNTAYIFDGNVERKISSDMMHYIE